MPPPSSDAELEDEDEEAEDEEEEEGGMKEDLLDLGSLESLDLGVEGRRDVISQSVEKKI